MTLFRENMKTKTVMVHDRNVSNIEEEKHMARASLSRLTPNPNHDPPWSILPCKI